MWIMTVDVVGLLNYLNTAWVCSIVSKCFDGQHSKYIVNHEFIHLRLSRFCKQALLRVAFHCRYDYCDIGYQIN